MPIPQGSPDDALLGWLRSTAPLLFLAIGGDNRIRSANPYSEKLRGKALTGSISEMWSWISPSRWTRRLWLRMDPTPDVSASPLPQVPPGT